MAFKPYTVEMYGKYTFLPTPVLPIGCRIPDSIWIGDGLYQVVDAKGKVVQSGQAVLTDADIDRMNSLELKQEIMRLRGRFKK